MRVGSWITGENRSFFRVWAPLHSTIELVIKEPQPRTVHMEREEGGFFFTELHDTPPGTLYKFKLPNGIERPDPASRAQPQGVHGFSQVLDQSDYVWHDSSWRGTPLDKMIIYELHIGTFTNAGTFEAAVGQLDDLKEIGINTIEVMPVAQFPGKRNWGYDGVYPYAVHLSYGGANGFKYFIDECHKRKIAVVLDVVYNHLGPEGNYLAEYGPYFTDKYNTPWGYALNFDNSYNEGTRNFFIENALYWFEIFHVDALRLDAVHAISDMSAYPFLKELASTISDFSDSSGKKLLLIAESDLNDSDIIRPIELGGFGIDAQWCDDFHHSLHALLTTESNDYYADFGTTLDLVKSIKEGYVYANTYSKFRKRRHGNTVIDRHARQFIVCTQNHDQVGNRMMGERLSTLVSFEKLKLAAGMMFLSPYIPMLFMGEEYAENNPFLYFVDHSNPDLVEAVRKGRLEEFSYIKDAEQPDPQSIDTFNHSKLEWNKRNEGYHKVMHDFYKRLITLRKELSALSNVTHRGLEVRELEHGGIILLQRESMHSGNVVSCLLNFNNDDCDIIAPIPGYTWEKVVDSSEKIWNGPGSLLPDNIEKQTPLTIRGSSFVVYSRDRGRSFPADRIVTVR